MLKLEELTFPNYDELKHDNDMWELGNRQTGQALAYTDYPIARRYFHFVLVGELGT